MSLASMAAMAMMMSDRKTKKNITKLGEDERGLGIYKFKYLWDKPKDSYKVGLMADEVEKVVPDAVVDIGGVKAVDYAKALAK